MNVLALSSLEMKYCSNTCKLSSRKVALPIPSNCIKGLSYGNYFLSKNLCFCQTLSEFLAVFITFFHYYLPIHLTPLITCHNHLNFTE